MKILTLKLIFSKLRHVKLLEDMGVKEGSSRPETLEIN